MLTTLVFTVQNAIVLHQREGTLFTSTVLKNYNKENNRVFTPDDGFRVAFGVVDLGSIPSMEDVKGRALHEYLEISARIISYDDKRPPE